MIRKKPLTSRPALRRARGGTAATYAFLTAWLAAAALPAMAIAAPPEPPQGSPEVYSPRPLADVRNEVQRWMTRRGVKDAKIVGEIARLWGEGGGAQPGRDAFERVIETFALADPETKRFLDACGPAGRARPLPNEGFVDKDEAGDFYSANLRLTYARSLTQRLMYDEALDVFGRIQPARVVDPATCLFYKAVCQHQLLMKKEGLETLEKLLHNTEGVAESYARVGALMQDELQSLDEQSLGGVSRKMKDSERRLDLGRGGQRVQKVQAEIVESLDEIIKKIEQQAQAMSQAQQGLGENNSNRSNGPAEDSSIKGNTAPGNVDKKNLKKQGNWGGLPPKDIPQAQNLLQREFPSNYRKAVEEYFKKLANRPGSK